MPSRSFSGGWNSIYDEMFLNSGDSSSQSRRKNNFGVPCGICGQLILGVQALTHHYNYHFLQNELAYIGRDSGFGGSPASASLRQPLFRSSYFQTHSALQSQYGRRSFLLEPLQAAAPSVQNVPSLRSYSAADMAAQLPLHPLLAQPPRNAAENCSVRQVRCGHGGDGRAAGRRPAARQQPPQDVIDVKDDDFCSDGSEDLDLTLSL